MVLPPRIFGTPARIHTISIPFPFPTTFIRKKSHKKNPAKKIPQKNPTSKCPSLVYLWYKVLCHNFGLYFFIVSEVLAYSEVFYVEQIRWSSLDISDYVGVLCWE